jgi:hypothetical protein
MASASSVDRAWIAAEFSKGIVAEQGLIDESKARAQEPPDPSLGVLYHEIAAADERHREVIETIATRYGHTPSRSVSGGIGESLVRLKERVGEIGTTSLQRLSHDLAAKANSVHWYTAWVQAFQAIGDSQSTGELTTILAEESAHRDALQEGLNRLVSQGALGDDTTKS